MNQNYKLTLYAVQVYGGRLDPNHCEIWMDVQVRAYYQAFRLLMSCIC